MKVETIRLKEKYSPDGSTLRKAQLRMLEMLKFIDAVCKENNIEYWIDYGTLLGAARHGGFIPWDDDTDICMTIENLKKFRKVMQTRPSEQFVLQNHDTDPGYFRFWDVVRDVNSEYVHIPDAPPEHYLKYRGLQVDIFPFEEHISFFYHRFCSKFYNAFIKYPLFEYPLYKWIKVLVPLNYSILRYILAPLGKVIGLFIRDNDCLRMSLGIEFVDKKDKKDIYPLKRISFEGVELNCPFDVDAILAGNYGDWRVVPDDEHIKTHNAKILFK